MADYYTILGVSKNANETEIKAAFRKLAKIYHPDKNPNNPDAKQLFESILKAYNTLIHPSSRRRYDQRISDTATYTYTDTRKKQASKTQTKEWTFTEEEMQRRQYYEKYYKAKQQERARQQTAPPPKAHSDYKYVLFATPIAVGLLMFIVSIFTNAPKTVPLPPKKEIPKTEESVARPMPPSPEKGRLPNGETPYSGYFGGVRTYSTTHQLILNNTGPYDAVVVLFDKVTGQYLQHAYLQSSYSIEFNRLPDTGVYWKCMLGKHWNENRLMAEETAIGAFDSIVQFQNRKKAPVTFPGEASQTRNVNLMQNKPATKAYISNEADFFSR